MEFDRLPSFAKEKYEDEFELTQTEVIMKPNISKEAVLEFLNERAESSLSKEEFSDPEIVSNFMIEEFKKSNCYNQKSEQNKNEIIKFLKENPYYFDDFSNAIFYDNNGNQVKLD